MKKFRIPFLICNFSGRNKRAVTPIISEGLCRCPFWDVYVQGSWFSFDARGTCKACQTFEMKIIGMARPPKYSSAGTEELWPKEDLRVIVLFSFMHDHRPFPPCSI